MKMFRLFAAASCAIAMTFTTTTSSFAQISSMVSGIKDAKIAPLQAGALLKAPKKRHSGFSFPNPIKAAKSIVGDIAHPLRPVERSARNIKQTVNDVSHGRFRPATVISTAAPGAAPFVAAARASSGPSRPTSTLPRR